MSNVTAPPPVVNVHEGRAALAEHLERYLAGRSLAQIGWTQPDDSTLLVPVFGTHGSGQRDLYLLRLHFDCYPDFPPTARFINPLTGRFDGPADVAWLPNIEMGELKVHSQYSWPNGKLDQLVCSSMNCDFYRVAHSVERSNLWDRNRHTFGSTLAVLRAGLSPAHYRGRMGS